MRFVLRLEAIGDSYTYGFKNIHRYPNFDRRMREAMRLGNTSMSVWVRNMENKSIEPEYIDYAQANHDGNRGIYKTWFLAAGRYEVNEQLSLTKARRYILQVNEDGTAQET